jgi:hypothetical protein
MATQAPINRPDIYNAPGVAFPCTKRNQLSDGSNTIAAQSFVKVSSGDLAAYQADDTAIYGLMTDASTTATTEPYLSPNGQYHAPLALAGQQFKMNITDGSGNVGSGSTTVNDVTIGSLYSARYLATVDTSCLAIDASDSGTATKHIFRVEAKCVAPTFQDGDATDDYNGRVIVSVIPSAIQ